MLYNYSFDEFAEFMKIVFKANNLKIEEPINKNHLFMSFVLSWISSFLLERHKPEDAANIFKILWNKNDLYIFDENGEIINVDEDDNVFSMFSSFVFEESPTNIIVLIDEFMFYHFYMSACKFCKIAYNIFTDRDPFEEVNKDFDYLINEDKGEYCYDVEDYINDFIPNDKITSDEYIDNSYDDYNDMMDDEINCEFND